MKTISVLRPRFGKREINGFKGLVSVVAQHIHTNEVLMLAYTDEAGYLQTLRTGYACYYSTSRGESWVKGETSNNLQKVVRILVDCDGDALIYFVEPLGNMVACHTDARTCFYRDVVKDESSHEAAPKAGGKEHLDRTDTLVHPNFYE